MGHYLAAPRKISHLSCTVCRSLVVLLVDCPSRLPVNIAGISKVASRLEAPY